MMYPWPHYSKEDKRWYTQEEVDTIYKDYDEVCVLLSLIDAQFIHIGLQEFYEMPSKLIDIISFGLAFKSQAREKYKKDK